MKAGKREAKEKTPPMRRCFHCGAELGCYQHYDKFDTCGDLACEKEARALEREEYEREEREQWKDFGKWPQ